MDKNKLIEIQRNLLKGNQLFDLEITTRCNKQCYCCPRQNFQRKNRDMSIETFEKVCDWLPHNCNVFFAGYGEPLLHNNILLFINKLSMKGVGVSLLTNGKLLTAEIIKQVFGAGLERLQISILLRDEVADIAKYVAMCGDTNGKIRFNLIYDDSMLVPFALIDELQSKGFEVFFKQIHNRANELYEDNYQGKILSCGTFFINSYIDTNGSLQVCSNDINGLNNLGNIKEMSFEGFREKKEMFLGNKEIASICKYCNDRFRVKHIRNMARSELIRNFRDVAKITHNIKKGIVYRSSLLSDFQSARWFSDCIKHYKINKVVDVRPADEYSESPYADETLQLFEHLNLVIDPHYIVEEVRQKYETESPMMQLYRHIALAHRIFFKSLFEQIDPEKDIFLIHCHAGKDRTGCVIAIIELLVGESQETIRQDYLESEADTDLENLNAFLEIIEQEGGIEKFLLNCGINKERINHWKQHLKYEKH